MQQLQQSLLILGASARAAAASAVRAGLAPRAIDLFADADLRAMCPAVQVDDYPEGLFAAAIEAPAAPWMYTGGLENYPRLVDDLAARRPLWGNRGETLRRVRDPAELAAVLHHHGLAAPESLSHPPKAAGGHWLHKPLGSSSGAGIAFWRPNSSSGDSGCYFQRYVEGLPCAAIYVADAQTSRLLGVTQQLIGTDWTGAAPFHYSGSLGPLPLAPATRAELERLGEVLRREFGLRGLFGVDGVLSDGAFWTIEVNPRYTASVEVLERVAGCRAIELHMRACMGEAPAVAPLGESSIGPSMAPRAAGKVVLFARQPLAGRDALWQQAIAAQHGAAWPSVADIPAAGAAMAAGAPILTLFADGADLGQAEARLRDAASVWASRLYYSP